MRIAILMAGGNIHGRMVLEALLSAGIAVDLVIDETGTPRAKKLGTWLANDIDQPRPMADLVQNSGCEYVEVQHFHGADSKVALDRFSADYIVNGGCGILKADFLGLARRGFLNAHPGLLPEFRGVDPVFWAVAEDAEVGATVHTMTEGIDEGPILLREPLDPLPKIRSVLELRLACMRHGAALLATVLLNPDAFPAQPQDQRRARYFGAFPPDRYAAIEAKLDRRILLRRDVL